MCQQEKWCTLNSSVAVRDRDELYEAMGWLWGVKGSKTQRARATAARQGCNRVCERWAIEDAGFRYQRKQARVLVHARLLCEMAHAAGAGPMLFDDPDPGSAQPQRTSILAPAARSPRLVESSVANLTPPSAHGRQRS